MEDTPTRKVPYVKDIFDAAARDASPESVIVFSNNDINFTPTFGQAIARMVAENRGFGYFRRRDVFTPITESLTPSEVLRRGTVAAVGADVFVFPVWWWRAVSKNFPDLVLGAYIWDMVMVNYLTQSGGVMDTTSTYHEHHNSVWQQSDNRWRFPSNQRNRQLGEQAPPGVKHFERDARRPIPTPPKVVPRPAPKVVSRPAPALPKTFSRRATRNPNMPPQ
jgi:hypothetical protein